MVSAVAAIWRVLPNRIPDAQARRNRELDAYTHKVVDHAVEYVDGRVHTNTLENFWSLLKRGLHGTYVSVEPFHLYRYLDEQMFRYNNRKGLNDSERFRFAMSQIGRTVVGVTSPLHSLT